jgi:hypothetical protein
VVYSLRGQYDLAPVVKVFDVNRKQIDHASAGKHQELRGWISAAGGTQFFLRVGQIHGVNEAYTLTLASTALAEEGEPNNNAGDATPLAPGRSISAFIANAMNDPTVLEDWYRIDARRDTDLAIDIDMSQGVAGLARLFDTNRRQVAQQSAGRGERFRFQAKVRPGVYHLQLRSMHAVPSAGSGDPPVWLTRPYVISLASP